jgi:predicted small metal-binding protein
MVAGGREGMGRLSVRCRDVGLDCDHVAEGEGEAGAEAAYAGHLWRDHPPLAVPDRVVERVRAALRPAEAAPAGV